MWVCGVGCALSVGPTLSDLSPPPLSRLPLSPEKQPWTLMAMMRSTHSAALLLVVVLLLVVQCTMVWASDCPCRGQDEQQDQQQEGQSLLFSHMHCHCLQPFAHDLLCVSSLSGALVGSLDLSGVSCLVRGGATCCVVMFCSFVGRV